MALPNLIGLVIMGGLVAKLTQNYLDRKAGKDVEPMLSAYPEQNEQFKKDLGMENDVAEEEQAPQTQEAEEVAPTQE
jgi:AGCS family alanine or glycine:cation symporter